MNAVRELLWGPHVLLLILAAGVWFTLRGRFMQLWKLPRITAGALRGGCTGGEKISAFQALSASLAGSLGTGNIIGVAAALTAGGPGAVVWMWISAFFGMMTVYAESVLAAKYSGAEKPGAIGYVQRAMGKPAAKLYAAGCVLSALGMGTMAQTGAVSAALGTVHIPNWAAGLLVAVLVLCVRGGLTKAVKVTEKLVPFMALLYVLLGLGVVVLNITRLPEVLASIVVGAFNPKAFTGGAIGSLFISMQRGVSRGIFSNEAGLGTGSIAHACADTKKPVKQGVFGIFEVFVDTIVICTLTALVILCSGTAVNYGTMAGADLTISGFTTTYGSWTSIFSAVALCCFAFSTIIGWGLYGSRFVEFLFRTSKAVRPFLVIYSFVAILGATVNLDLLWNIADTFNGLMSIPNLIALLLLSGTVVKLTKEFFAKEDGRKLKK